LIRKKTNGVVAKYVQRNVFVRDQVRNDSGDGAWLKRGTHTSSTAEQVRIAQQKLEACLAAEATTNRRGVFWPQKYSEPSLYARK